MRREPTSVRGRRSKAALVAAARSLFEKQGFAGTSMNEIAQTAGVAHGTAYTYFDDKLDVLRAVVAGLVTDINTDISLAESADPVARIYAANDSFLATQRRHRQLWQVVEEVGFSDPEFANLLHEFRTLHGRRVTEQLTRLAEQGRIRSDQNPQLMAAALTSMVEGFSRQWPDLADQPGAANALTQLWCSAIELNQPATKENHAVH